MVVEKAKAQQEEQQTEQQIPDYLIKEEVNGIPFYYKGYKNVLNKTQTLEDIMGSSGLQFVILQFFLRLIAKIDSEEKYYIGNNEAGLHLATGKNMTNDIALYSKAKLTPDKITKHYADVPPDLVIEVDIDFEVENRTPIDAVHLKTQQMLDFGVQKVIWIFTNSQKVMVAKPDEAWTIVNWNEDIELMAKHTFNIAQYLKDEGINPEGL